jgi:PadR family transcriptional regulator, regulatory protein PadR
MTVHILLADQKGQSNYVLPWIRSQLFVTQKPIDRFPDYNHNVVVMIGEFEYLIISAAARLGDEAYGAAIRRDIEEATGHQCSIGALYTTLDRLRSKGLVETWMGEPTAERGGRAKRMVRVTRKGAQAASAFYRTVIKASRNVSWETR